MKPIDQLLLDPAAHFSSPEKVLNAPGLTRRQKIDILRHWEYDARELEVAEEENMIGNQPGILDKIVKTLLKLKAEVDHGAPTKQGGE